MLKYCKSKLPISLTIYTKLKKGNQSTVQVHIKGVTYLPILSLQSENGCSLPTYTVYSLHNTSLLFYIRGEEILLNKNICVPIHSFGKLLKTIFNVL